MAAVQLKDLMNPLTKIEQSTRQTVDKLDELIGVLTGTSEATVEPKKTDNKKLISVIRGAAHVSDSLQEAILQELAAQTHLLNLIANNKKGGGLFGRKKKEKKSEGGGLKAGGEALAALGAGTSEMAKALILFTFVPKKSIMKFQNFVVNIFQKLTEVDQKKVAAGAKNLQLMSDGIYSFSKSLALSAVLLIPGMIAIPFLIVAIGIMSGVMYLIGSKEKQISKGAKALDKMGDALKSFGIGVALFAVATLFIIIEPKILLGMVASLVLITGAVALIGLADKQVKKGAVALGMTGVALGVFAVGYGIFAAVTSLVPIESLIKQALILGGIGAVTALIGLGFTQVALGAIALALVGVGLAVFSVGYGIFAAATKDVTTDDVLVQAAVIGGIGGAFALIGIPVVALGVILGSVAMGIAGLSLIPLSLGLKTFQMLDWKENDSTSLASSLAAVRLAFTGGETEGGFLSKLGGAFTGVLDSGVMIASAAAFGTAGLALISLSAGLSRFQAVGWKEEDSIIMGTTLGTITAAFAQAGGEPSNPGGLFGQVFGTAFSPNATERGISSVMDAGEALTSIAKGLTAFQDLVKSEIDFVVLSQDIEKVVGFVSSAFALIGGEEKVESGGFFSSLFGIKSTKTEEGIRSVRDAGDALTGIADGLISFKALVDSKIDFVALSKDIGTTVGFVSQAFSAIGGDGANVESGGFFSSLFGVKSTATEEGIRSVKGAGEELKQIADGLLVFQGFVDKEIDWNKLSDAVTKSLGFVGDAFASIGGKKGGESSLFGGMITWDQNQVDQGISAVKGAGEELKNIADGLLAFSQIEDPAAVALTIKTLLESLSGTFTIFYDKPEFSSRVDNFTGFITTMAKVADDGSLMKAADGFEAMAEAINSVDIDKAEAFRGLFEASAAMSERGRSQAAMEALVESIADIKLALNEQGGGVAAGAFEGIKSAFGLGDEKETGGKPDVSMNAALQKLQTTLTQVNNTLANLPGDIAGIEIKLPRD